MRRFLRSSTKPAASGSSSGSSSGGFRLCILHHVLCVCRYDSSVSGGVCGERVSRCSAVLHRGIRGHRGRGGAVRLFGGVRLVGGVRGIVARHVRFTGFRGQFGQHHTLGLAALVNAADAVCIAVLFQRGLLVLTLRVQLPVVQVLVLQLGGVKVFVHVLAVVDGLVKLTGVIIDCVITVGISVVVFDRAGALFIHPDHNTVVLTKRRNTVRIIADDVRSAVSLGNSTFYIVHTGSIDGGVASGAVDGNGDILHRVAVFTLFTAANGRRKPIVKFVSAIGNGSDRTAGDGDVGLANIIMLEAISDSCRTSIANGGHIGVVRDRDGSIYTV